MSVADDPTNPFDGASQGDPGIAYINTHGPRLISAMWSLFVWPSPVAILFWGFNQPEWGSGFVPELFESVVAFAFWVSVALWFAAFWAFRRETILMFLVKRGVKHAAPTAPMAMLAATGQTPANKPAWGKFLLGLIGAIPSALGFLWRWRYALLVIAVCWVGYAIWQWIEGLPKPFQPSRDSLERTIESLEQDVATERVRANVAIPAIEEPQTFRRNTDRIREEYDAGNERLEAARHAERLDFLRTWRDSDRELRDAAVSTSG